jgi:hypothetical protein
MLEYLCRKILKMRDKIIAEKKYFDNLAIVKEQIINNSMERIKTGIVPTNNLAI